MARYAPTGHLVLGREGFLLAVPFGVDTLELHGSPVPVVQEVRGHRSSGLVDADVASNGLLAYVAGSAEGRRHRMVWRDSSGETTPLELPVGGYDNLTISPDGTRIAFASARGGNLFGVYVKAADGSGEAEPVLPAERLEDAGAVRPFGWTADGETLIVEFSDRNAENIASYALDDGEVTLLADGPASESTPALSPDGRWLAYASDEAGPSQVFVRAYPGPGGKPRLVLDGLTSTATLDYDFDERGRLLIVEPVGAADRPPGVTIGVNWLGELARNVPSR